ncbi:hypothetical protein LTR20_007364 [Exophiala xenobiotica]|nr:hypothetical protein LTS06_008042 [Exophiala xenobiotica]KAK5283504.1 hypothetical protein LTR40_001647 [Exophiala xenobiotica]KAK5371028.1 hypothetical protein LTS13_006405 [Exophiala xenobiotica]KAK5401227.1 hypothetical protein LTR79_001746 [Exophiala xenobiotica]KAK5460057.1 hypothetical protein LTR20_007364 [Exophiala xenobiotica]
MEAIRSTATCLTPSTSASSLHQRNTPVDSRKNNEVAVVSLRKLRKREADRRAQQKNRADTKATLTRLLAKITVLEGLVKKNSSERVKILMDQVKQMEKERDDVAEKLKAIHQLTDTSLEQHVSPPEISTITNAEQEPSLSSIEIDEKQSVATGGVAPLTTNPTKRVEGQEKVQNFPVTLGSHFFPAQHPSLDAQLERAMPPERAGNVEEDYDFRSVMGLDASFTEEDYGFNPVMALDALHTGATDEWSMLLHSALSDWGLKGDYRPEVFQVTNTFPPRDGLWKGTRRLPYIASPDIRYQ